MRIVVAMDKFKGSLTAFEASRAVSEGLKDSQVTSDMDVLPISDGGEGTTAAVHQALGGELREVPVPNAALSRQVAAPVLFVDRNTERVAVMEMSAAAGLELLRDEEREPARASTKGVGEMIAFAQAEGADRIIIGIGGSATNDGGVGMAQALGFSFLDASGEPVSDLPACRRWKRSFARLNWFCRESPRPVTSRTLCWARMERPTFMVRRKGRGLMTSQRWRRE